MSHERVGARAALVAAGVLVSMALMAAPSWAAKGGNSANAALCEPGGYAGVLFEQDGSAFKNAGKCTSYAAKGGQLVGLDVVAGAVAGGGFPITCSGFGLPPGLPVVCATEYGGGESSGLGLNVAPDGTFSGSANKSCTLEGEKVVSLVVEVFTATFNDILFQAEFPPPSDC